MENGNFEILNFPSASRKILKKHEKHQKEIEKSKLITFNAILTKNSMFFFFFFLNYLSRNIQKWNENSSNFLFLALSTSKLGRSNVYTRSRESWTRC